jgi:ankyrin repeat protein
MCEARVFSLLWRRPWGGGVTGDLYQALGLPATASQQAIEHAYWARKRELTARNASAHEMQALEAAAAILRDPARRTAYDRMQARGALGQPAPARAGDQPSPAVVKPGISRKLWQGEIHPAYVFFGLIVLPFLASQFVPAGPLWLELLPGVWFLAAAILLWRAAFRAKWVFWGYASRSFVVLVFVYQAVAIPGRWYFHTLMPAREAPMARAAQGGEGCINPEAVLLQAVTDKGASPEETAFLQTAEGKYLAAALAGRLDEVKRALDSGVDVRARDKRRRFYDNSALDHAARTDNVALAKLLLARGMDVNSQSKSGHTALHVAAGLGSARVAEFLLQSKADPNLADGSRGAPLDVAVLQARPTMAKILLKYGADKGGPGRASPLKTLQMTGSLCNGHREIIRLLVASGSDLFTSDKEGRSGALGIVMRGDDTAMVLAREFPDLDWMHGVMWGKREVPLLMVAACAYNSRKTLQYLLTEHPKKDQWRASASGPWGTLAHCAEGKPAEFVTLLLEVTPDVNLADGAGDTPLHKARTPALIGQLLQKGAKPDARDANGKTPVMAMVGNGPALGALAAAGADLSLADKRGRTLAHYAVENRNREAIKLLAARRVEMNARDSEGITPLFLARDRDSLELVLAAGGDVKARTPDGRTPLHVAIADRRSTELVIGLLDKGVDPLLRASDGTIPLHHLRWEPAQAQALLAASPKSANAADDNGRTPLHYMAERGSPLVIAVLVEGGASIDRPDKLGNTPLHLAAMRGNLQTIKALVGQGADPRRVNNEKKSAFDLVRDSTQSGELTAALRR